MKNKNIVTISKIKLKPNHADKARAWLQEWQKFINDVALCGDFEVLAADDQHLCWIEHWGTKEQLDKFVKEHMIYSGHIQRLNEMGYAMLERELFKKIV